MTSFWGNSIAPDKPLVVELDPCAELNITAATLQQGGKPGKAALLKICADGGDTFTLATLVPGAREHQRLDVQLGAGNEKVVFTVSGGAKVDLTGYRTVPEEYGMIDDDDDEEEEKHEKADESRQSSLAEAHFGATWDDDSVESEDDDHFETQLFVQIFAARGLTGLAEPNPYVVVQYGAREIVSAPVLKSREPKFLCQAVFPVHQDLAEAYGPVGTDRRLRRWVRGRL